MKNLLTTLFFFITITVFSQENNFITYYEKSDFLETANYDEVIRYSKLLAETSPWIHYEALGISPQGREIPLLILDKNGNINPETVRASGNAILFVQAGIHPGESEGTDAVMMFMRDIAVTEKLDDLLEHLTILVMPVFNVDGLARFGPYNRINQNGPKEMGWRVTAQNMNLNRDFLKADTPEMYTWLTMFNTWLPDFFIDCHTTDGADYKYHLTYMLEIFGNMDEDLTTWQKDNYFPELKKLMDKDEIPIFQYVSFRRWHDPRSGLISGVAPPRMSQGYTALQNRPGLLIETHMLKPYKIRVEATYHIIKNSAEILNKNYKDLKRLVSDADQLVASPEFRKEPLAVSFKSSQKDSVMVKYEGFEYIAEKSDLTGGNWFKYSDIPITYTLPWFNKPEVTQAIELPEAYIIPPEWTAIISRLPLHDIEIKYLDKPVELEIESYKFIDPKWRSRPYEGRHSMTNIEYEIINEKRFYPEGSVLIDMNQRSARVIAHILEPKATDSYVYWGFFDAIFEQKEYSETYVMEGIAREMLKEDEALRKEFELKKTEDENFTKNQWQMLNWFYMRSPYADWKKDMYPVGRIMDRKIVSELLVKDEK